ncbi:hypothetical protein [Kribbella sp. CA-294648]|uniref:hypothetical protein n=1 Tax=Kribbella sp. CA-294648 TaxID=3239948 RepID=UPI003D8F0401
MTSTGTSHQLGVEWAGTGENESHPECDARGWPILHANDPCDGINPLTGRPCIRNWHNAYHRDAVGTEWLDDE